MPCFFPQSCHLQQLRQHRSRFLTSGALLGVWNSTSPPMPALLFLPCGQMEIAQLSLSFYLTPPCPRLSYPIPHFSYVPGEIQAPIPQQRHLWPAGTSDSYMDSTWAFPLTSTAAGFIPLFLAASLFPHGLLFYLGAHDCIWQGLLIVSTDFTRDWF